MNTRELPYIEPVYGKHAAPLGREQVRPEAIQFVTEGHRIHPGFGKHRRNDATESWAA